MNLVSNDVQVPGSVLAALVQNGDIPDPNIGQESLKVPDIGVTGPEVLIREYINAC